MNRAYPGPCRPAAAVRPVGQNPAMASLGALEGETGPGEHPGDVPRPRAVATEPWQMEAHELAAALARRELSAAEALRSVLDRADHVAEELNPFATRLDERARAAAAAADRALGRGQAGPLCGVPVTIKDSQWLAGVESTSGSLAKPPFVPDRTCAAVELLERSGAVVFATTATPEFCYTGVTESRRHGRTNNPWNRDRTPGGSSGGAGAAVAAGAGPLSLGGDGGGSIRIPSAFCGLVGLKPSFGLVPREPCGRAWYSLVSNGPMARSVADARLMLSAVSAAGGLDLRLPGLQGVRLVVSETRGGTAPVDDDVLRRFREAVSALEAAGAEVVEDDPGLPSSVRTWAVIASRDAWNAEREVYEAAADRLTVAAREMLEFGREITDEDVAAADAHRSLVAAAHDALLDRHGAAALLTPTVGCEAFAHGQRYPDSLGDVAIEPPWLDWAGFLYDANLTGMPAIALPCGRGDDGLPVSLQLMSRRGSDGALLALAEAVELVIGRRGLARFAWSAAPDTIA
jgi:Asp-tRNA(Asn)/Glu-tRNA(Gln) amidotransferase A subunit family amidase